MLPSESYRGRNQDKQTFAVGPSPKGLPADLCGSVPKTLTQDNSESFGQRREVMVQHYQVIYMCCSETGVWICVGLASF